MVHLIKWLVLISCFQYCWSDDDDDDDYSNAAVIPPSPLVIPSVWPLTNNTLGYDVLSDTPSANMHGRQFITHSPDPTQSAFHLLNGETFVDIPVHVKWSEPAPWQWSIVVYVYLLETSSGILYEYIDTAQNRIFQAWLENNGRLYVNFYNPDLLTKSTTILPTNVWFQLALVRYNTHFMIYRDSYPIAYTQTYFPAVFVLKQGTLRIGRKFQSGHFNTISVGIWCFRVYSHFISYGHMNEAERHCWNDMGLWKYKGPYGCMYERCLNEAVCEDQDTSVYTCNCTAGYTGQNCQTDIDDCQSLPCLNRGTCQDGINSYSCLCGDDFTGEHCETLTKKDYDQGYFTLIASDQKPDDANAMAFMTSSNTRDCGKHCVQTPGCRSFATDAIEGRKYKCTMYSDVLLLRPFSNASKYYIPKY